MFRHIKKELADLFKRPDSPIVLILGLRQVGKSTLAQDLLGEAERVRFDFDLAGDRQEFLKQDRHALSQFAQRYQGRIIIIDEVQKMPEATSVIKHLYDTYHMKFLLTGSSELKIRQQMGDSLVGRLHESRLYPLSLAEMNIQEGLTFDPSLEFNNYDENQKLLRRCLVYGSLPQLSNIAIQAYKQYLDDFVNGLISKDVLEIAGTRKSSRIYLLAKLLALQIGHLVNFNELAANTEMARESVHRYIDIFEQMGIVVKAKPISTNEREAISKKLKIYFTDLGVRNSLVGNFEEIDWRMDRGQLLENAVFIGIKRARTYAGIPTELGFFRSSIGTEIDIVEKAAGIERLYEVKMGNKKSRRKKGVEIISFETAQKYLY
ncbi:ATP-binding protein [Candidatus Collierbacteria bacterium]|nr:ATP-binding protein [Candidatus Collierbacteria bacterium]